MQEELYPKQRNTCMHLQPGFCSLLKKTIQPRSLSFQRALQGMSCGTLLVVVPVSTTLVLPQLEATLSIHCSTAAALIIFGDSFVSNLNLKCAICTAMSLFLNPDGWMFCILINYLWNIKPSCKLRCLFWCELSWIMLTLAGGLR